MQWPTGGIVTGRDNNVLHPSLCSEFKCRQSLVAGLSFVVVYSCSFVSFRKYFVLIHFRFHDVSKFEVGKWKTEGIGACVRYMSMKDDGLDSRCVLCVPTMMNARASAFGFIYSFTHTRIKPRTPIIFHIHVHTYTYSFFVMVDEIRITRRSLGLMLRTNTPSSHQTAVLVPKFEINICSMRGSRNPYGPNRSIDFARSSKSVI